MKRRILLVGATGTFGSRLATLLAGMDRVALVLAARRVTPLEELRLSLIRAGAAADISVHAFDRSTPERMAAITPWLVVDAAGPFQDSDYRVALAAVRSGAHFIDLADARAYVCGFRDAVDQAAREAGVLAVTAASSTPALSNAAADFIVDQWGAVDDVTVAISPGARAPRGLAVVEAILSYVGQPVRLFHRGAWTTALGWSGTRRVYMPGLGYRLASICETPDLDILPARLNVRRDAVFMAGLEVGVMHRGLAALGLLVRWGILSSLRPLARPLVRLSGLLALFGTDRGGMIVAASGAEQNGRRIRARWALWAEQGAGPNVPAAPAAAMIRALLEGREIPPGAYACVGMLRVDDIMRELGHLRISTHIDTGYPDSPVLFERLLGHRWAELPPSVRAIHGGGATSASGSAVARIGKRFPARIMRLVMRLPTPGLHDVTVEIAPDRTGERWTRRFGSSRFVSRLSDGDKAEPGMFEERVGLLRFMFEMRGDRNGVVWQFAGWRFAGLKLPRSLAPRIRAAAEDAGGLYRFRVVVAHPWIGLLFAYRGALVPPVNEPDAGLTSSPSEKLPS